jgi:ketosteroid isomerase-like protein
MKAFPPTPVVLSLFGFVVLFSQPLAAQEWSAPQKEVWRNVESYWYLDAARDLGQFMAYFHEEYLGWYNRDPMPHGKTEARKWSENDFKTTKVLYYHITPLTIKIHGDIAIVHYYFTRTVKDAEGKQRNLRGRWTDILSKQEGKWIKLADHGGPESGEQE